MTSKTEIAAVLIKDQIAHGPDEPVLCAPAFGGVVTLDDNAARHHPGKYVTHRCGWDMRLPVKPAKR